MKAKVAVLTTAILLVIGCASMTPRERALTSCDEFMTQYEVLHNQSLKLIADPDVSQDTKRDIVEKINPKLNQARKTIISYCDVVLQGQYPTTGQITSLITDITLLFQEVK